MARWYSFSNVANSGLVISIKDATLYIYLCHINALIVTKGQLMMVIHGCFMREWLRGRWKCKSASTGWTLPETPTRSRHT